MDEETKTRKNPKRKITKTGFGKNQTSALAALKAAK